MRIRCHPRPLSPSGNTAGPEPPCSRHSTLATDGMEHPRLRRDLDPAATLHGSGFGTDWTARCAARFGRPLLVLDPGDPEAASAIRHWLIALEIQTLNVAGP